MSMDELRLNFQRIYTDGNRSKIGLFKNAKNIRVFLNAQAYIFIAYIAIV
jgi:hypothetical protein